MAYRFRLETVLGLRRNLEELAQQRLAKELLALEEEVHRLEELQQRRLALIDEFENKKKGLMDAPLFIFYMDGIGHREREIEMCRQRIVQQQRVVEAAREELATKMRERKGMEKARERDYQRYLRAQLAKEQNEADEQIVLRFGRHGGGR